MGGKHQVAEAAEYESGWEAGVRWNAWGRGGWVAWDGEGGHMSSTYYGIKWKAFAQTTLENSYSLSTQNISAALEDKSVGKRKVEKWITYGSFSQLYS